MNAPESAVTAPADAMVVARAPLDHFAPSLTNGDRHAGNKAYLEELAVTIKDHGVIQPITARPWPAARGKAPAGPEMSEADARRIVACVNACAGVPSEILQSWINPPAGQMGLPQGPWHRHLVALGAQRAELARLLQAFLAIDDWTDGSIAPPDLITETKAALAALEGLTFEEAA